MIVADASAIVELLTGDPERRQMVGDELRAARRVHAPDLLTLEVLSALTRATRQRVMTGPERQAALDAYASLPINRHRSHPLWPRIARLTALHSSYDAAYVALAELLDAPLLTTDAHLARAVTTVAVIHPG